MEPLQKIATGSKMPTARLHAICTLQGLAVGHAAGEPYLDNMVILAALSDEHPAVREHAVRIAEKLINNSQEVKTKVCSLATDANARVRFQVAFTLGELRDRDVAVDALAKIAQRDADNIWTRTAILSSVPQDASILFTKLLASDQFARPSGNDILLAQLVTTIGTRGDRSEVATVLARCLEHKASANLISKLATGLQRGGASISAVLDGQPQATRVKVKNVCSMPRQFQQIHNNF
jgi:hypothetical protein